MGVNLLGLKRVHLCNDLSRQFPFKRKKYTHTAKDTPAVAAEMKGSVH